MEGSGSFSDIMLTRALHHADGKILTWENFEQDIIVKIFRKVYAVSIDWTHKTQNVPDAIYQSFPMSAASF